MTGRFDSDIFLFPWLSRSFFPSSSHTAPSLRPPSFLPFPPHPGTAEPFRKTEVEAAARKMVQPSPLPHGWGWRLTPSWEDWRWLPLWSWGQREVARELRSRVPCPVTTLEQT